MPEKELHVVTGAFGYSGKYIAARLLNEGHRVRTLTNSLQRANPFGASVEAHPFNFDHADQLAASLRGAAVLYNTYWVRFNYAGCTHALAVENTLKLFRAAKEAGVKRVVHVSIANPSESSPLEYFRGKAALERALIESGLSYAILRPAVLFGKEDILVNNIAWALRRFPVLGVFGDGQYKLRPIYIEDFAELAVAQGRGLENRIVDALGPETFTYRELVREIGRIIGKRRLLLSLPPWLGYLAGVLIGRLVGDVMITRDEIEGLMQGLLYTPAPPAGQVKLTEWAGENAGTLGLHYHSEIRRRDNRKEAYDKL